MIRDTVVLDTEDRRRPRIWPATEGWVLFVGAGFAVNSGLPDGKKLLRRTDAELGLPGSTFADRELVAACTRFEYSEGKGREPLIVRCDPTRDRLGETLEPSC
jgi:hypothetical protein